MKKTICLGIVLSFLIVFFSFNVSAQGITFADSAYNSQVVSGVTANITVTRYYPNNEGTAAVPGSTYLPYMVYIQIYNNNDSAALVNSLRANISFTNNGWIPQIYNVDNFSSDLTLSFDGDTVGCRVSPSASFSYGNGIVVPPKQSLYLIAEVQVRCDWNQTNTSDPYSYPILDSVSCGNFTVGLGDYPYSGDGSEFDDVIDAINNLDTSVGDIENILSNILNNLTYSGSAPVNSYGSLRSADMIQNDVGVTGLRVFARRVISAPVRIIDYEYNSTNDNYDAIGIDRYSFTVFINVLNTNNKNVKTNYYNQINNVFPDLSYKSVFTYVYSDSYLVMDRFGSYLQLYNETTSPSDVYSGLISPGHHYVLIKGYIDLPTGSTITYPDMNISSFHVNATPSLDNVNTPYISNLLDLFNRWYSINNNINDQNVTSDSNSVGNQSDSNHAIEESYYSSNSDAILATGLSNYRFSNDQSNGIGSVSNDFTAVWNALGSYNSVYIFSLTLSIALMIFRHVPGVISRKLRSRNDGDG